MSGGGEEAVTVASACTQDCRRRVRERACRGPVGPVEFAGVGWEEGSPHFALATLRERRRLFKHLEKKTQTSPLPDPLL